MTTARRMHGGWLAAWFAACVAIGAGMPARGQVEPLPPVEALPPPGPAPGIEQLPTIAIPAPPNIVRLPACTPAVNWYAFGEALAFQRNNGVNDVPLVVDGLTNETLLSAGELNAPFAYGARALVGARRDDGWGYEAGYLGLYGMTAARSVSGSANLQLPGPLASLAPLPFLDGDLAEASYASTFQSAEFNVFRSCCGAGSRAEGCIESACGTGGCGCCCIDWLGGFRYANLAEQAGLTFTCCTAEPVGPFATSYDVRTTNNLFGGQLGGRAARTWQHWGVEGWAKAGMFANVQTQSQAPILDPVNPGTPARTARSASGVQPAMLADLNVAVVYRLTDIFSIRVGYGALWVGNVALAPDQWDFGANADSGTRLAGTGGLFLTGATLGLDARW